MGASGPSAIERELAELADPARAAKLRRFFKTGPGEYGEGDRFLGIRVGEQRRVAARHRDAELDELEQLLASPIHEHRLTALLVLVAQFERAEPPRREQLAEFFLAHRNRANNWDLVDTAAPKLLADRVRADPRRLLDALLVSESVWDRRIAVLATFTLIRAREFAEALRCAETLLGDEEDLIHKATGWMLREVGKRDEDALRGFLDAHAAEMPRTMLRYAIERLDPEERRLYMAAGR